MIAAAPERGPPGGSGAGAVVLLGRHVHQRAAGELAGDSRHRLLDLARDAEVKDVGRAILRDHYVAGLHVLDEPHAAHAAAAQLPHHAIAVRQHRTRAAARDRHRVVDGRLNHARSLPHSPPGAQAVRPRSKVLSPNAFVFRPLSSVLKRGKDKGQATEDKGGRTLDR